MLNLRIGVGLFFAELPRNLGARDFVESSFDHSHRSGTKSFLLFSATMAAMSRGPVAKPQTAKKVVKGGTPSSRKHHFESFSQRITKLKIEPIRRGRSTVLDDAELDTTFSYFQNSLDEWRGLNLSETFTAFVREVTPLSENLGQIIYHNDRILNLLVQYIEKGDAWSEEPLLSLMAHLAHDLGVRFEKHFERAVKTVSHLAAKHQDVAVVEWSFTCLAWLFKYLSRLLVPDLRPVFDLMAPLLGKEHQKVFVTRFAAESLSFLIRKAGAIYYKDKIPLQLVLNHISNELRALQSSGKDYEFRQGLMSLFADSMKGVLRGLHSSAIAILKEMLLQAFEEEHVTLHTPPLEPILSAVVTSVIHHTDADNFEPLLDVLLQHVNGKSSDPRFMRLSSRLLFIVSGVRQGSRIKNWASILETLKLLTDTINKSANVDTQDKQDLLAATAVAFQYCSLDAAIQHVQMLESFSKNQWEANFLPFCTLFANIGTERFKTLLLPYFKRFVAQKADEYGPELCLMLHGLSRNGVLSKDSLHPSSTWCKEMILQFQALNDPAITRGQRERTSHQCNAILEASSVLNVPVDVKATIAEYLRSTLEHALDLEETNEPQPVHLLAAGNGLKFLVQESQPMGNISDLWSSLCRASSHYGHALPFWQSLRALGERNKVILTSRATYRELLHRALMQCLGSPSHEMRLAALGILELTASQGEEMQSIIATAMMIEQTPLNFENVRSISMRIRQLAKLYPAVCEDPWVGEAIPSFCFGLLHVKSSQIWDDVCSTLKDMCEKKEGEAHVTRIALEWLTGAPSVDTISPGGGSNTVGTTKQATEFECTNLIQLEQSVTEIWALHEVIESRLTNTFDAQHAPLPFITSFSRAQGLRLLNAIPRIAEKRSRQLVPILLDWALAQPSSEARDLEVAVENNALRWTRKDQKALLSIFSQFTNPKVLFKSAEVYDALLVLLSNGDAEVQKAALKAILTWKDAAIARYQENLLNLLDDARFRDEISVFLDVSEEESHLREEHRDKLLPIILRLLYGKVIRGNRSLEAKRRAVIVALTRFGEDAIHQFLGIAFGSISGISLFDGDHLDEEKLESDFIGLRQQVGMLNMLEDMLSTLKAKFAPLTSFVIDPLLYCLIKASRGLSAAMPLDSKIEGGQIAHNSLLRTIRQRALHSLNLLFESCPDFTWGTYAPAIVKEIVNPRLENFPVETAQSVSGLLRLFAAWSKFPQTAHYLVECNPDILTKIIDCLEVPSAKDEVKQHILDNILRTLVATAGKLEDTSNIDEKMQRNRIYSDVLQPYATTILQHVGSLLRKSPSRELLDSGVQTVAELASQVVGSSECRSMIEISTFLLRQPSKRVSIQTKLGLLSILHEFIPRCDGQDVDELFDPIFDITSSMFSFARDQITRKTLCEVIEDLSARKDELQTISKLCGDLNSFSTSRLDEPDFERRSSAFSTINQDQRNAFSLVQWKPLVYNMLYYIKDNEELSIRVNASLSLRRFIDASVVNESFKSFMSTALLPGVQNGMRESSELVRIEFLAVLAHLVAKCSDWPPIADLHVLLEPDDESSVLGNVLHIQGHRRLRALRRLASNASQLQSNNINHVIVPLLEHFIFDKGEDVAAHNLAGEAIRCVASLSEWLEWPQFRSLLRRFIGYLSSRDNMQKTIIKLLSGMMDSLNRAGRQKGCITTDSSAQLPTTLIETNCESLMDVDKPASILAKTLPQQDKLTTDLTDNLIPPLTNFLHQKDESTVSLRVPIAIAVTKVLLVLPPHEIETRLPAVLLDVCHILKSRSQDGRDMARNTLAEIANLTGPSYLSFILKSMRTALQRGYQLHVLSFTLHHILVKISPELKPGDLDYCLPDIIDVIMDDIFGVTGQEKDAEDYISKMREVKSSKSYDSMDIIARSATPTHLVDIVRPIHYLLIEKLTGKMVTKIDELLRRIGLGILQNPSVRNRDILVFCYELVQEVYKVSINSEDAKQTDPKLKRYLVNMKGAAKSGARGSGFSYIHKITRFSLDILRTVLRKHEDLQTPQNLAGFLPIIGDALVQGQEEVQISAIRLLTTILRVPLPALDKDCPVYVTEAVQRFKTAPSTNTELAQASLKMISAILRERSKVTIKERDLAHLLKRLLPDLDEPDRQGVTFGFIRAVMNRNIVIAEVYEVMDKVATMMVTNQTRSARDLSRTTYFHFLMEYPQAKKRFDKQLEFLVRNLRYDYVEGRQSVMEALNLILSKVGDDILQDKLEMMFLPLVHSMANDDSSDCRTMAGALLRKIFERGDSQRLKSFTSDLRGWLEQDEDSGLKRLGIQCWGLYFEATEGRTKDLAFVLDQLQLAVEECLVRRDEDDWELIYYSLTVFSKLCKLFPDTTFSSNRQSLWAAIQACVSYPHAWVKLTAAKLIGILFADIASMNGDNGLGTLPLPSSKGLLLTEESMIQLTNAFLKSLSILEVTEEMCAQSIRNTAFLARCLAANGAKWNRKTVDEGDDDIKDNVVNKSQNGVANGETASSDEEWSGFSPPPVEAPHKQKASIPTAIHRLITRLSGIIRRETKIMKLASLHPKTATMTLLETLTTKLPIESISSSLSHLLTTLSTLSDPATTVPRSSDPAFNEAYKSLIDKAREIMSILQKRIGTEEYLKVMGDVQKEVKQRREDRRTKRKIEAVTMPEKWSKEKRRRHDVARQKRKEKSAENRGRRRGW